MFHHFVYGAEGTSLPARLVVWFGEGVDYDLDNPFTPDFSVLRDTMKDAIEEAIRAGVSFYGVDARGLGAGLDDASDVGGVPVDDPYFNSPSTAIQNEVRRAQDNLRVMSEQTGGFAIVNQNDFNTGFQKIVEDNSSYYVLGYYSTDGKRDGGFRNLTVRVKQPGMQVRARKGYVAPRGRPPAGTAAPAGIAASAAMREALDSPVPVTGLSMSAFAAPMIGAKPNASVLVVIEVDGHDIAALQKAFAEAAAMKEQPTVIIAHTVKGKGVSFMENNPKYHGTAPTVEEEARALAELA